MTKQANGPVYETRCGHVKVLVWESETANGTRHNGTACRMYKDGDERKKRSGFGRDDLLPVAKAIEQAHTCEQ